MKKNKKKMTKISEESTLGVWSNENWNDKDQWKKINLIRDSYSSRKRTGHGDENLRCSGSRWTKDTSGRSARKK